MATVTGLLQQSDVITMEFTRCWDYLGKLGIMAKEVAMMLERETSDVNNSNTEKDIRLKQTKLERISTLAEKVPCVEMRKRKFNLKRNATSITVAFAARDLLADFHILKRPVKAMKILEFVESRSAWEGIFMAASTSTQNLDASEEYLVSSLIE